MLHVARRLYRELTDADPGRANRFELSEELIALLAGREWLLVVDEAQWLNRASASNTCATSTTIRGRSSRCSWSVATGAGGSSHASRCFVRGSTGACDSRRCARQTVLDVILGYHLIYRDAAGGADRDDR